jgi:putative aldouronate transport system substrate-binding protein
MIVGLFGACQPSNTETSPSPTATAAPATATPGGETVEITPEPAFEGGDGNPAHNLAAGKYEVDEDGVALEEYIYELPLTTAGETYTFFTSPVLADEFPLDTYGQSNPYAAYLQDITGLTFEYILVSQMWPGAGARQEAFSIAVASDDIADLTTNVDWYWNGVIQEAYDQNYFTNLYDYLDYMPNYWRAANAHPEDLNLYAQIVPFPEMIYAFWTLEAYPVQLHNIATRGDYLERLGLTNDDVLTMDQLHEVLLRYKTELDILSPMIMNSTFDSHNIFSAFDTPAMVNLAEIGPPFLDGNGKVQFANSTENDKKIMTMWTEWYKEGLFPQDWMTIVGNATVNDRLMSGEIATTGMVPTESVGIEYPGNATADPNAFWVPLHKPVLYEGQTFHLGDQHSWKSYGSYFISGKTEEIPVLVSYCDWFYSDEGIFTFNYGLEGISFEYDNNGNPQLTDFILNHTGTMALAILTYSGNDLVEGGVSIRNRNYAFPGGERFKAFHEYWDDPQYYKYDASMQWPSAVTFTVEEQININQYAADMATFLMEQYVLFLDGSKPMTEWDSYLAGLDKLGWNSALLIYQNAYDRFISIYG